MPVDLETIADPRFILLAWAAGLALVVGLVSLARVVGPGFNWLTAATAGLIGLAGTLADGAWWARIGAVFLIVGLIWARNRPFAGVMFLLAGVGYLIEAALLGGWVLALTASVSLGGVTGEMLLGHWYLIDPSLPRWTLRALATAGIVGLSADALGLALLGGLPGGGGTVAFWILTATSIILMVGVLGSLRYPAYSGVMAATGLSYLAVLTTLGGTFLGRALVAGLGPFAN
ncbi:MAG: hypothetical protein V3S32_07780 [Acidimicrobiia bacterium]